MASSTFLECLSRHWTTKSSRLALLNTESAWLLLSLDRQHNMTELSRNIY